MSDYDDPVFVTIPCFFAISVEVPAEVAEGKSDHDLMDMARDAADAFWEAIKWPDSAERDGLVSMWDDNLSDAGPLLRLHQGGGVAWVSPLEAVVER